MALPGIYDVFQRWANQTVWIYSDPHFGDKELAAGVPNRPSASEQVKKINECVGRKDTIIFLGDIGDVNYIRQIRGRKILVMGNHDAGRTNYKRVIKTLNFDVQKYTKEQVREKLILDYPGWDIDINKVYDITTPPFIYWEARVDNCLFDEVYEGALIVGEKLILSHEPVDIPWLFNIHGHDHAGKPRKNHLNVCSDVIGYKPVNFNKFLKEGHMSKVETIHRQTIDKATDRKKKRGGKKIGQR